MSLFCKLRFFLFQFTRHCSEISLILHISLHYQLLCTFDICLMCELRLTQFCLQPLILLNQALRSLLVH